MNKAEFILIVCGALGVIFHSLVKLNRLYELANRAKVVFEWRRDYLKNDFVSILLSFLSVTIWFLLFGEVATRWQWLTTFPRFSFFCMGYFGSYWVQYGLGRTQKVIEKIIDDKTHLADEKKAS